MSSSQIGIKEKDINKALLIFLWVFLTGCVSTEQFRMNTDEVIGEKPLVNAVIVLDTKHLDEENKD